MNTNIEENCIGPKKKEWPRLGGLFALPFTFRGIYGLLWVVDFDTRFFITISVVSFKN